MAKKSEDTCSRFTRRDLVKLGASVVLGSVSYWQSQRIAEEIQKLRELLLRDEGNRQDSAPTLSKPRDLFGHHFSGDRS